MDTWCKDEGISKRLKKNMLEPAKYLKRERRRKEAKSRKEKGQMCTYTAHFQ